MKAFVRYTYGGPSVLKLEELEKPEPADDEVLVKVKATSLNPYEWRMLRANPFFIRFMFGFFKPKQKVLGSDFAGTVEAVGKNVSEFKPGDEVFGEGSTGAFGEYNCVKENLLTHKPSEISYEEAAGFGIAAITALQGIRDFGKLQTGERVLINGASGGVGHYCVQLAKAYGAYVTAICGSSNMEFVRALGADQVLDHQKVNIHKHEGSYDLVIDVHGNLRYSDYGRLGKRGVIIGFTGMGHMFRLMMKKSMGKMELELVKATANTEDFNVLARFYEQGKLKTHLDKVFEFEQLPMALSYLEEKHPKGKVAVRF